MARCLCCGKEIDNGLWHKRCIKSFFNSETLPEISVDESSLEKIAIEQLDKGNAVQGVQEKLSLHLDFSDRSRPRLTVIGYPTGYILKPQTKQYKRLPEFEQTAMLLADACNIPVVPHGLIPTSNNELAYITKRIDRVNGEKIHMEDFAQASGLTTSNKYRSSYESCAELIVKYSKIKNIDIVTLFSALYFNFVIGNSDVHLKNFSFIYDEEGNVKLAPFYDLLPTKVILTSDHDDLGMLFDGQKSNLHKHNFDNYCLKVGIPNKVKEKIMEDINNKEPLMEEIINNSLLDQNSKSIWIKMIKANIKRAILP